MLSGGAIDTNFIVFGLIRSGLEPTRYTTLVASTLTITPPIYFDNRGILKTKLYDKRDSFTFPIVNFPFISSISASPAYGVYISELIRYSRACAQYIDFLDRAQLLTQKPFKQGFVAPMFRSLLQKLYDCHHDLVDCYEICISQMTMDFFTFYEDVFFPLSQQGSPREFLGPRAKGSLPPPLLQFSK